MLPPPRHRRSTSVLQMTAVLCLLLLTLYTYTSHHTDQPSFHTPSKNHLSFPIYSPPETPLRQALLARLNSTNAAHRATAQATEDELNLKLDYMSLDEYRQMLEDVFLDIFALPDSADAPNTHTYAHGTSSSSSVRTVRVAEEVAAVAKQSFGFVEPAADVAVRDDDGVNSTSCQLFPQRSPIPHTLNTIVRISADLPPAFSGWRDILPSDWNITVWNESTCESWLSSHTSDLSSPLSSSSLNTSTTSNASLRESAFPALLDIYRTLPLGVVQSDLFRYIITYFLGGIYTDSDTAPTQPVDLWMMPTADEVEDLTPPGVLAAESLLRYQTMLQRADCKGVGSNSDGDAEFASPSPSEGPPQLIVALESTPAHWQGITEVGLQLVQYAFAASPGHPVFLDLMSRVAAVSRTVARQSEDGDFSWNDDGFILTQWSGPGLWTEAVYRYLGARWGFDVRMLDALDLWDGKEGEGDGQGRMGKAKKGVRVGDVLILRRDAFRGRWKSKQESELEEEEAEEDEKETEKDKERVTEESGSGNGNGNTPHVDNPEDAPDREENVNTDEEPAPESSPPESQRYIRHGSFGFGRWRAGTERAMAQMKALEDMYAAKKQAERERQGSAEESGSGSGSWRDRERARQRERERERE